MSWCKTRQGFGGEPNKETAPSNEFLAKSVYFLIFDLLLKVAWGEGYRKVRLHSCMFKGGVESFIANEPLKLLGGGRTRNVLSFFLFHISSLEEKS